MAGVTTEELQATIKDFLKGADLNALSAKKLRKKLEDHFSEDFTARKKEIDDLVMTAITASQKESQSDDEGSEDEDEDSASSSNESSPKKKRESSPSPSPPPKKLKPKDSSDGNNTKQKEKDASDGSDSELDDEALARKLQEEERLPRRRAAAIKKAPPRKRNTKKDGDKPKRENSAYSKKCILSESLAAVVGAKEMARHGVVKRIWEVAKERNLFDPKNKRYVLCDEQLQKIFENRKRVLLFGMMKYLKSHITDSDRL